MQEPSHVSYLLNLFGDAKPDSTLPRQEALEMLKREFYARASALYARLEASSLPVQVDGELYLTNAVVAQSAKGDFEDLFGVGLTYETFTYRDPLDEERTGGDWRMEGTPSVPEELADIVRAVSLNHRAYPC